MTNSRKSSRHARAAPGLALERGFAPAHNALIGFELDKDVGAVGVGSERNAEDLHAGDADPGTDAAKGVGFVGTLGGERGWAHRQEADATGGEKFAAFHQTRSLYLSRALSSTAIPRLGAVGSGANPSLTVSTGAPINSARMRRSASALGIGMCWMKKLGRLAARCGAAAVPMAAFVMRGHGDVVSLGQRRDTADLRDAVTREIGPENIDDFVAQRVLHFAGLLDVTPEAERRSNSRR